MHKEGGKPLSELREWPVKEEIRVSREKIKPVLLEDFNRTLAYGLWYVAHPGRIRREGSSKI